MRRFYADAVLQAATDLQMFESLRLPLITLTWYPYQQIRALKAIEQHMDELGCPVSAAGAQRFRQLLERISAEQQPPQQRKWWQFGDSKPAEVVPRHELVEAAAALNRSFRDELRGTLCLAIPDDRAPFFTQEKPPFGEEVASQFPSVGYDAGEAAKCYALGRATACAYHAIRCLEAGITAISRCLDIPDPVRGADRSWGRLLERIEGELDRRWPRGRARFDGDGRFFEEAYGLLRATQNPYRNATMHLDSRYELDEAFDIMSAVRRFMQQLAKRMDEQGLPRVGGPNSQSVDVERS